MRTFFIAFCLYHFSWPLVVAGFVYSMVAMGSYGTVWLHRYGTHGAYEFKSKLWRLITRNLVIRTVPDEIYIISHHVHHAKSEQPGDPYNPFGGALYCFLADTNHQPIATDLTRQEYETAEKQLAQVVRIMPHHRSAHWARAQALIQLGRNEEAQEELQAHVGTLVDPAGGS